MSVTQHYKRTFSPRVQEQADCSGNKHRLRSLVHFEHVVSQVGQFENRIRQKIGTLRRAAKASRNLPACFLHILQKLRVINLHASSAFKNGEFSSNAIGAGMGVVCIAAPFALWLLGVPA